MELVVIGLRTPPGFEVLDLQRFSFYWCLEAGLTSLLLRQNFAIKYPLSYFHYGENKWKQNNHIPVPRLGNNYFLRIHFKVCGDIVRHGI